MNTKTIPFIVLEKLRQIHPLLCLGVEQRGALLSLHKTAPALSDMPWLASSVIAWAFQRDPLYLENAQKAAAANFFSDGTAADADELSSGREMALFAGRVCGYLPEKINPQLQDVLDLYDIRLLTRFLLPRLGDADQGVPLLASAWDRLLTCTARELPLTMLEATAFPPELARLKARLKAEWAMHHLAGDDPEQALDVLNDCDDALWGQWKQSMRAMLLVQAGETAEAQTIYTALFRAMPWHVNACLMAHALRYPLGALEGAGMTNALSRSDGVSILLYSWNKSGLLARTLDSLHASDIGKARIVVLDNGSTDAMPEILRAAEDRFGADRFSSVRLPVNIGAPGARNWLLSLPEVRQRPLAAFLDDDVILPSGWLGHLLAASNRLENFGAVGCRIVSAQRPYGLQSADYNNYPLDNSEEGCRLGVFNNTFGQLDMGMYGYDRPCLSVSGCCHLLNMRSIEKAGLFDIRYNPTQFDDLDRDLRSCLAGFPSYYAGSLRVCHVQHSSMEKADTTEAVGQVGGNQMKLQARFDDMELTRLFDLGQVLLWGDLLGKAAELFDE